MATELYWNFIFWKFFVDSDNSCLIVLDNVTLYEYLQGIEYSDCVTWILHLNLSKLIYYTLLPFESWVPKTFEWNISKNIRLD